MDLRASGDTGEVPLTSVAPAVDPLLPPPARRPHPPVEVTPRLGFEEFYRSQRREVGRALAVTFGDYELAAEAVDEAMTRAYARWSKVSTLGNPGGWVYRVGFNWGIRYFDDVARQDRLGDTPVGVVVRRGRRRKARRRTTAMAGTLAVGALGSVFAVRALSGDDRTNRKVQIGNDGTTDDGKGTTEDPAATVEPAPSGGAPGATVASPLVWNSMTVGSAEALGHLLNVFGSSTDGNLYALGSEPGRTDNASHVLYHSTDGLHWEVSGAPPALSDRTALVAGAGRLYTVGTQAASASSTEPWEWVLASSDDHGATWTQHSLPVDVSALRALPLVEQLGARSTIATAGDTTVIATVARAKIDAAAVAPPGVDPSTLSIDALWGGLVQWDPTGQCNDGGGGAGGATVPPPTTSRLDDATATTIVVLDRCDSSPARAYSWAELGVPPESVAAARGQLHLAVTRDGATFTDVPAPALPEGWTLAQALLAPIGDGLLLTVDVGRTNAPGTTIDPGYESQSLAYTSIDGATWTPLEVPLGSITAAGLLANGELAVVGTIDGVPAIATRLGDGSWHTTAITDLLPAADLVSVWSSAVGRIGVAVLTGPAPVMISPDAGPPATVSTAGSAPPGPSLLFSRDGIAWSVVALEDLAPQASPEGAAIVGEQIVIDVTTGSTPSDPDDPLPDRQYLVGTLAG